MNRKRAGKCNRRKSVLVAVSGAIILVAAALVLARVIVQSEDHPRVTTIDPHSTLKPVTTQPASTTTTTTADAPELTVAPEVPADEPSFSQEPTPLLPTPTTTLPWHQQPQKKPSHVCFDIGEHEYCVDI